MIFILLISCVPEASLNPPEGCTKYWKESFRLEITPEMIADGDTFYLDGKGYRVVGVDTPEIHNGGKPKGQLGEEAKEYFEWWVEEFHESVLSVGEDRYGRELVYLFGTDGSAVYFYEASVTEMGLARPLIYEKNSVPDLIEDIVDAYRRAWKERKGIFSLWESAPVIRGGSNWESYIGKIVWLEDRVESIFTTGELYIARGNFASFIARKDGYRCMFGDFDFRSLEGKTVRVYGELWEYDGHPEIMVRAPFEIVVIH